MNFGSVVWITRSIASTRECFLLICSSREKSSVFRDCIEKSLQDQLVHPNGEDDAECISLSVTPSRLLIGNQGDILDVVAVPVKEVPGAVDQIQREVVLVTNSSHLRVMNTETQQCRYLEAHTDIALAVDVSPDG